MYNFCTFIINVQCVSLGSVESVKDIINPQIRTQMRNIIDEGLIKLSVPRKKGFYSDVWSDYVNRNAVNFSAPY